MASICGDTVWGMAFGFYPSETIGKTSFAGGANVTFNPWVPIQGPTGRRNVILGVLFKCVLTDVDVATAVVQGEDVMKLWPNLTVKDVDGDRVNATGQGLRHMLHLLHGPLPWHESADLATGTPTTTESEFSFYLPYAKPNELRPEDWAIGADVAADIVIQGPTQGTLDIGTSAVTLNDISYTCIAITREEDDVETKMRDVIFEEAMTGTTEHRINGNGRFLAETLVYADGASGGASMANWTDHRIVGVLPEPINDEDMLALYRHWRNAGDHGATPGGELTNDPFAAARARVVHMSPPNARFYDRPYISKQALLKATNTVSSPILCSRMFEPVGPQTEKQLQALYGISSWEAQTPTGKRQSSAAWGDLWRFMNKVGRNAGRAAA